MIVRKIIFTLLFLTSMVSSFAQNKKWVEDILYLKNNWILHGTVSIGTDSSFSIKTKDGNIFVFQANEVDSVCHEKIISGFSKPGFGHYTEIGALASTENRPDNVTTAAFSFQTINGYNFKPYLFSGIGAGVDLYATQTIIPVFAGVRGNITNRGTLIPFYFLDGGYGINITSAAQGIAYRGGLMAAGGFGVKVPMNTGSGFLVSFGYRIQNGATIEAQRQDFTKRRIAIRAGFYL